MFQIGIVLVIIGTTLFSSKSILIQWIMQQGVNVEQLMVLRMSFSFPLFLAMGIWSYQRLTIKPQIQDYLAIMLVGILCYHLASYLDMWALQSISAGLERILLFSYPIFVTIYQRFRGEKFVPTQYIGAILSYLGILIFFWEDQSHTQDSLVWGVVAMVIAAMLTAMFTIASQTYGNKLNSYFFTSVAMGITALSIGLHTLIYMQTNAQEFAQLSWNFSAVTWFGISILAIACTLIASICFNRGISLAGASAGSIAGTIGPIITIVLSALFFGEIITWIHWFGVALVVLGVGLVSQHERLSQVLYKYGVLKKALI